MLSLEIQRRKKIITLTISFSQICLPTKYDANHSKIRTKTVCSTTHKNIHSMDWALPSNHVLVYVTVKQSQRAKSINISAILTTETHIQQQQKHHTDRETDFIFFTTIYCIMSNFFYINLFRAKHAANEVCTLNLDCQSK